MHIRNTGEKKGIDRYQCPLASSGSSAVIFPNNFQDLAYVAIHQLCCPEEKQQLADSRLYMRITPSSSLVVNVVPVAFH